MEVKKYYKDIDLIRLFSCIAVLLYHLNILNGGYLAVCIFFVISGYLSCVSLFKKNKISLKDYYKNRLIKLYLPLLVVVFVSISIISLFPSINWFNLKNETTTIDGLENNFKIPNMLYSPETIFGNKIKVYDIEKTVCDFIKNRKKIDSESFVKCINRYKKRIDKNVNNLMKYAKIMGIEDEVFSLMEILLNED